MVTIGLNVNGTQQLSRTLARWANAMIDLRPAFEIVATEFARMELSQFATQGAISKDPWTALSPRYAARKARTHPGAPILVRSGDLRRDLTRRPFGVEEITSDSMRLGTTLPYARYHQTGTPRMPRRPPVNLTEYQRQKLVKIVQDHIVAGSATQPRAR